MAEQGLQKRDGGPETTRAAPTFIPTTDIYETGDALVLMMEMPGVAPNAIDVKLDRRTLSITGCLEGMTAPEGFSLAYAEYRDGNYERSFTLSEDIDADRIRASMKDGLLKLVLPKAGPQPAKTIEVKTG